MAPAGVAADRLATKRTIDLRPPGPGGGSARGKRTTPISARMRLVTTCARRAEHASVPCNKGQRDELEPVRRRLSAACGTNEGHGLAEALSRSVEPPVEQHGPSPSGPRPAPRHRPAGRCRGQHSDRRTADPPAQSCATDHYRQRAHRHGVARWPGSLLGHASASAAVRPGPDPAPYLRSLRLRRTAFQIDTDRLLDSRDYLRATTSASGST
jgi:hypothetical protein